MPGIISEITNAFSQCSVPPMSAPCLLPLRYNYYSISGSPFTGITFCLIRSPDLPAELVHINCFSCNPGLLCSQRDQMALHRRFRTDSINAPFVLTVFKNPLTNFSSLPL